MPVADCNTCAGDITTDGGANAAVAGRDTKEPPAAAAAAARARAAADRDDGRAEAILLFSLLREVPRNREMSGRNDASL